MISVTATITTVNLSHQYCQWTIWTLISSSNYSHDHHWYQTTARTLPVCRESSLNISIHMCWHTAKRLRNKTISSAQLESPLKRTYPRWKASQYKTLSLLWIQSWTSLGFRRLVRHRACPQTNKTCCRLYFASSHQLWENSAKRNMSVDIHKAGCFWEMNFCRF